MSIENVVALIVSAGSLVVAGFSAFYTRNSVDLMKPYPLVVIERPFGTSSFVLRNVGNAAALNVELGVMKTTTIDVTTDVVYSLPQNESAHCTHRIRDTAVANDVLQKLSLALNGEKAYFALSYRSARDERFTCNCAVNPTKDSSWCQIEPLGSWLPKRSQ